MQSNSFSNRLYKILSEQPVYFIYFPLIIYWITLFMLTTIPTDTIPRFFNAQDKVEHLIAYFVLAVLLTLSLYFQKWSNFLSSKAFLFSVIFLLFYAALDEVHQIFVPGRYCDIYDWLSDAIGGLLGTGLVYLFLRSYLKKRANAVTASV